MNLSTDQCDAGRGYLRHTGAGFSLIELLVAVTIVAVLVAVLLPVLSGARRASRRVACQANLRQVAMAWGLYWQDFDGRMLQGLNADVAYGGWWGSYAPRVDRPLNPYLGLPLQVEHAAAAQVFGCPADDTGPVGACLPVFRTHGTSYRTNILLIGPDRIPFLKTQDLTQAINARLSHLRLEAVTANPARLVLLGDFGWVDQWWPASTHRTEWHDAPEHHNVAFLDGHVRFLQVVKGVSVAADYTVVPFEAVYGLAMDGQAADGTAPRRQ